MLGQKQARLIRGLHDKRSDGLEVTALEPYPLRRARGGDVYPATASHDALNHDFRANQRIKAGAASDPTLARKRRQAERLSPSGQSGEVSCGY
jgi:hypothetical protein